MRIAVLLKGIFYMKFYEKKQRYIDYRNSFESFKKFFQNHEVDYYISTYDNELKHQIINDFKPVAYDFRPYLDIAVFQANNMSFIKVIELFRAQRKSDKYDFIIITRSDITFQPHVKFEDIGLVINPDVHYIMLLTKRNGLCEDNFCVVGENVISNYQLIINRYITDSPHRILRRFANAFPDKVRYYNYLNHYVTPGSSGFYNLHKHGAAKPLTLVNNDKKPAELAKEPINDKKIVNSDETMNKADISKLHLRLFRRRHLRMQTKE